MQERPSSVISKADPSVTVKHAERSFPLSTPVRSHDPWQNLVEGIGKVIRHLVWIAASSAKTQDLKGPRIAVLSPLSSSSFLLDLCELTMEYRQNRMVLPSHIMLISEAAYHRDTYVVSRASKVRFKPCLCHSLIRVLSESGTSSPRFYFPTYKMGTLTILPFPSLVRIYCAIGKAITTLPLRKIYSL